MASCAHRMVEGQKRREAASDEVVCKGSVRVHCACFDLGWIVREGGIGPVLVWPGGATPRGAGHAGSGAEGLPRSRFSVPRGWPVHHAARSRVQGGTGQHRPGRGSARRPRSLSGSMGRPLGCEAVHHRDQPSPDGARQAGHRAAAIFAVDAGDLRYGREPEGAPVFACGGRPRRADIRPVGRMGEDDGGEDWVCEVRISGRAEWAEASLLPGLPAACLYAFRRYQVSLARGRGGLDDVPRVVEIHEPCIHELRLYAGAADERRRVGCVRPHRTTGERV